MNRLLGQFGWAVAAVVCLATVSCEPGSRLPETGATLEGTVVYGKEPVPVALIIVVGDSGSAQGFIGEDGRYKLTNVPLGTVKIGVNTDAAKGELTSRMMAQSQGGKVKVARPRFIEVPKRYGEPATSGLTTTINKGANTFDIVIPR